MDREDYEIAKALNQKQEIINDLQAENAALRDWKESCLSIEKNWDIQAVGKLIGVPWGQDIRREIEPYILKLKSENKLLLESRAKASLEIINLSGKLARLVDELVIINTDCHIALQSNVLNHKGINWINAIQGTAQKAIAAAKE